MSKEILYQLPMGWVWTTLGEVTLPVERINKSYETPDSRFMYIDIEAIDNKGYQVKEIKTYSWGEAPSRAQQRVKMNDILFANVRPYLKNIAVIPQQYDGAIASTGFCVLRPLIISSKYVFYYTLSQEFIDAVSKIANGTSYPAVTNTVVLNQALALPPLEEQYRIVQKIEELFGELDEAEVSLKKVMKQIEIYRYAILKNAFKGDLTNEWRDQNKRENSKKYLIKIKMYRNQLYTKKLKAWQQNPVKNKKPTEDIDMAIQNKSELSKLPVQWIWEPLGNISNIIRGASPRPAGDTKYFGGKIPWITVGELTKDDFVYLNSVSTYVTELGKMQSRYIEKGNLLLTNSGATLGVPKINLIEGCINDGSVAILDLIDENIKLYLYWFLKSKTITLRKNSQGAGQPNLNTSIIKNILIPLPSYNEMIQVIQEIEYRFIIERKLKETVKSTLGHINILRTTILKKAFSGKLVEQDYKDESVNELLTKITVEKNKYLREQRELIKAIPKRKKIMEKKSIIQILKDAKNPMSAKDVWLQSKHKQDIEAFYFELRELQNQIVEIKKDTESLLSLRYENR